MLDLFKMELEAQAALLGEGLLSLEQNGPAGTDIEPLMRAAHSIKGAARILEFEPLVQLSHAMEDIFVAAQEGAVLLTPAHVDVLLAGADLFARLACEAEEAIADWVQSHAGEIQSTRQRVEGLRAPDFGAGEAAPPADAGTAPAGHTPAAESPAPPAAGTGAPQADGTPAAGAASPPAAAIPTADAGTAPVERTAAAGAGGAGPGNAGEPGPAGPPAGGEPVTPAPPAPGDARAEADRVVRISAANLRRVVGLAGECLVETHNLSPLVERFQALRGVQRELLSGLDRWLSALPADLPAQARGEADGLRETAKRLRAEYTGALQSLESATQRLDDNTERLFGEVLASRMRPFEEGTTDLARAVRDLARQLGKRVRLRIDGRDTRVDRDILDKLKAPLTHIVRNALDHGIELPAERAAAGKPEEATLQVRAAHRAGMLSVEVRDDGRGIDPGALRRRIVERGLTDTDTAARLTLGELYEFLFLPGFSTAETVTDVSGRGVGLDVVASTVQAVSGSIRVDSEPGRGTCFLLQLPVTRSVLRALLVDVDGEAYALPLARLDRSMRVPAEALELIDNRGFLVHEGENIGLISARQLLGRPLAETTEELAVVMVSDRDGRYGVVVDDFLGERTIVVHPLDRRLGRIRNISAASVMEDGTPLLIFDVDDLVRSADAALSGLRRHEDGATATAAGDGRKRILVVDDSLTVRELERRLLEAAGYAVDVAVNGVDGLNAARAGHYDLVVSDVDMPRMNGIELVRQLKADARLAATPVVIVSYKDRPEDHARGLEAGADYYLAKSSFQDETLLRAVEELIGGP